jgi:hypothetical protein
MMSWRLIPRIKYSTIWFLDWIIDVRILRHSIPRYCDWIAFHPWWDALDLPERDLPVADTQGHQERGEVLRSDLE